MLAATGRLSHFQPICPCPTIDDVLPLHQLPVQLLQVLLLHSQTPRISFQLLCLRLKLPHQLAIHHLRPCVDRGAVRLVDLCLVSAVRAGRVWTFIGKRLHGLCDLVASVQGVGGLRQVSEAFNGNLIKHWTDKGETHQLRENVTHTR